VSLCSIAAESCSHMLAPAMYASILQPCTHPSCSHARIHLCNGWAWCSNQESFQQPLVASNGHPGIERAAAAPHVAPSFQRFDQRHKRLSSSQRTSLVRRSEYVQCSPLTRPLHSAAQAALARVTACVLDRDNADPHSRVTLRLMFPKAQKQKVMILTLVMWLLKVESQILVHRAANVVQKRRMARWGQFYYVINPWVMAPHVIRGGTSDASHHHCMHMHVIYLYVCGNSS
jgi:hypothetical protein